MHHNATEPTKQTLQGCGTTGWLVTQRFGGGTWNYQLAGTCLNALKPACFISSALLGLQRIWHLRHRQPGDVASNRRTYISTVLSQAELPDSIVTVAVKTALGESRWWYTTKLSLQAAATSFSPRLRGASVLVAILGYSSTLWTCVWQTGRRTVTDSPAFDNGGWPCPARL